VNIEVEFYSINGCPVKTVIQQFNFIINDNLKEARILNRNKLASIGPEPVGEYFSVHLVFFVGE
jgi:hypothetical protein